MFNTNFIVINSKYRTKDSRSTSDFTYSIGQTLEVDSVTIKNISIPNVYNNINKYSNTLIFKYNDGVSEANITLPIGQYNIQRFMTDLGAQMSSVTGGTVSLTLSDLTNKIEIVSDSGLQFETNFLTSPLAKILGFEQNIGFYPTQPSTVIQSPDLPQLQGTNNFYIASRVLCQGYSAILTSGIQVPIIMNVPISVPYAFIQQYESDDTELNTKVFSRLQNINQIDIKVYDDDLNLVDLDGQDVEIILKVNIKETNPYTLTNGR